MQALQASISTVTGQEPEYFVAWAGATDGRFYRQAGIDTVGYGPGGENAHGANEAVQIDDLVTQAKVYVETITRVLLRMTRLTARVARIATSRASRFTSLATPRDSGRTSR